MTGEWVKTKGGGHYDQTYVVDGNEVGWVEQETERVGGISGPHVPTGRYHWYVGGSKGGSRGRLRAKQNVERRVAELTL